jgi:lauroyl/myristoyl acyltransferase
MARLGYEGSTGTRRGVSERRPPPFGQGRTAARVLRVMIGASAAVGGRLPARTAHALAHVGGTVEWAARPAKRRVLAQNLAHALGLPACHPDVRATVRREVQNEARRSADFLWAVAFPDRVAAMTRVEGLEHLRAALDGGRGAIVTGPHLGGWEVVTPLATSLGITATALVDDNWLAWAVADIRRRAGLRLISVTDPARHMVAALLGGEVVVLLPEVAKPGMRTAEVQLLGSRVRMPAGPATLARLTGAPIVPIAALPIAPRSWLVQLDRPIPAPPRRSGRAGERTVVQALADRWTPLLRAHPDQWAAVDPMPWLTPPAAIPD